MPGVRYIHKRRAIAVAAVVIMCSLDGGSEGMTNSGQQVPFWGRFEDHCYFSPSSVVHMQIGPQVELNPAQPSIDVGFLLSQKTGAKKLATLV